MSHDNPSESIKKWDDSSKVLWLCISIGVAVLALVSFIVVGVIAINYQTNQMALHEINEVKDAAKNEISKIAAAGEEQYLLLMQEINKVLETGAANNDKLKKVADDAAIKTVANIVQATKEARDFASTIVPPRTIVAIAGTAAIPAGWAECNGQNGTPDLRGRFIRGYGDGSGAIGQLQPASNSIKGDRVYSGTNGIGGGKHVMEVSSSGDENRPANVALRYIMKL